MAKGNNLTSKQMADLVGIMARRPAPSRGALGVKGVKVFVEWVKGYAPPHRAAAITILTDLINLEPVMLSGDWKKEATERMAVCVDPSIMDDIQLGVPAEEGDERSEEERNLDSIHAWAAQTDEDVEPEEDGDEVALPVGDEDADPDAYPDFGALHDAQHGGIVNPDADPSPDDDET